MASEEKTQFVSIPWWLQSWGADALAWSGNQAEDAVIALNKIVDAIQEGDVQMAVDAAQFIAGQAAEDVNEILDGAGNLIDPYWMV